MMTPRIYVVLLVSFFFLLPKTALYAQPGDQPSESELGTIVPLMSSPLKEGEFENALMSDGKPPTKKGKGKELTFATQVSPEDLEIAKITKSMRERHATKEQIETAVSAIKEKYVAAENKAALKQIQAEIKKKKKAYIATLGEKRKSIKKKEDLRSYIQYLLLKQLKKDRLEGDQLLQKIDQAVENNFSVLAPLYTNYEQLIPTVQAALAHAEAQRQHWDLKNPEITGKDKESLAQLLQKEDVHLAQSASAWEEVARTIRKELKGLESVSAYSRSYNPDYRPDDFAQRIDSRAIVKRGADVALQVDKMFSIYRKESAVLCKEFYLQLKASVLQKQEDPQLSSLERSAYKHVFKTLIQDEVTLSDLQGFPAQVQAYFQNASGKYNALVKGLRKFNAYPKRANGSIDWSRASNAETDTFLLKNLLGEVRHKKLLKAEKNSEREVALPDEPLFLDDYKKLKQDAQALLDDFSHHNIRQDAVDLAKSGGKLVVGAFVTIPYLAWLGGKYAASGMMGLVSMTGHWIAGDSSSALDSQQVTHPPTDDSFDSPYEAMRYAFSYFMSQIQNFQYDRKEAKKKFARQRDRQLLENQLLQDPLTVEERKTSSRSGCQLTEVLLMLFQTQGMREQSDSSESEAEFRRIAGEKTALFLKNSHELRQKLEFQNRSILEDSGDDATRTHREVVREVLFQKIYPVFLDPSLETYLDETSLASLEAEAFDLETFRLEKTKKLTLAQANLSAACKEYETKIKDQNNPALSLEEREFQKIYLGLLKKKIKGLRKILKRKEKQLPEIQLPNNTDLLSLAKAEATEKAEKIRAKRKFHETKLREKYWEKQLDEQGICKNHQLQAEALLTKALSKYERGLAGQVYSFGLENPAPVAPVSEPLTDSEESKSQLVSLSAFLKAAKALEKGEWTPGQCWKMSPKDLASLQKIEAGEDYPAFIQSEKNKREQKGSSVGKQAVKEREADASDPSQKSAELDSIRSKEKFLEHYVCLPEFPSLEEDLNEECWACQEEVQCTYRLLSDFLPTVPPERDQEVRVPISSEGHKLSQCGHLIHKACLAGHQTHRGNQMYSCLKCKVPLPYHELDQKRWEDRYGFSWEDLSSVRPSVESHSQNFR